jgi:DNA-binding MarR family transcriptional regulator
MSEFTTAQFREKASALREHGLTPGHLKAILSFEPGQSRPMGACASGLGCDASTATWLIDRLEERGLVERRPSTTDRRVKEVLLTGRGAEVRAELKKHYSDPPPALLDLDEAVLEELLSVLQRMTSSPVPAGRAQ